MINLKQYITTKNISILIMVLSGIMLVVFLFSKANPVTTNETALKIMRAELDSLKAENARLKSTDRLLYEAYETRKKVDSVILDNAIKNKNEAVRKIHGYGSDSLSRYFENL